VGGATASATAQPSAPSGLHFLPMEAASYVNYDFIPADTTHLKNEGFCVIDHLFGKYKHLEERMSQWLKDNWNDWNAASDDDEFLSGLDETDWDEFGRLKRNPFFTPGITPLTIQRLCIALTFSIMLLISPNNVFGSTYPKKNHNPFVYYAINIPCYLVDNKEKDEAGHNVVQSLIQRARPEDTKVSSVILGEEFETKANIYNENEIMDKYNEN
jgi:hypothetical protein